MGKFTLTKQDKEQLKNFKWEIIKDKESKQKYCIITGLSKIGKKVENLIIPDCVQELANNCFYDKSVFNTILKSVKFGKNLKVIGNQAFFHCENLVAVDFEEAESLEKIGGWSFKSANLLEIRLPKNLKLLENAFKLHDDGEERKLYIPKDCKIGFEDDKNLLSAYLQSYKILKYEGDICETAEFLVPDENMSMIKLTDEDKFSLRFFNYNIRSESGERFVVITGLTELGKAQQSLIIPDCVHKVGRKALYNFIERNGSIILNFPTCLKTLSLGKNLVEIEEAAFYHCGLEIIDFSKAKNLKKICKDAFYNNFSLKEVILPESVKEVEESAFWLCNCKVNIPQTCKYVEKSFYNKPVVYDKFSDVIPQYKIEDYFVDEIEVNKYLHDLEIAKKEYKAKEAAEYQQRVLSYLNNNKKTTKELKLDGHAPKFSLSDRKNFDYSEDPHHKGYYVVNKINDSVRERKVSKLVFPDCITAFYGATPYSFAYIREVVLSKNLLSLPEEAFQSCEYLQKVNLQDCVLLEKLSRRAFGTCGLESVIIPINVKVIENAVFAENHNLKKVAVSKSSKLEIIKSYAFSECESLKEIDLSNAKNLKSIGDFAFGTEIFLEESCFLPTYNLEKVILPDGFDAKKNNVPKNIFGSGIDYKQIGNALVPNKQQQKAMAEMQMTKINKNKEQYQKFLEESAKIKREREEKEFHEAFELALEYRDAGIKNLGNGRGQSKNLQLALDNLEMSYKYDKDPYVATLIEEVKARIKSGEPITDVQSSKQGYIQPSNNTNQVKNENDQQNDNGLKEQSIEIETIKEQSSKEYEDFDDFVPKTHKDKVARKNYEKDLEAALNGKKGYYGLVALKYRNGTGCHQDIGKAVYWYEKAIRAGFCGLDAMFVAECYYNGIGVNRDLDKAYKYAQKAYSKSSLAESQVKCEEFLNKINEERGIKTEEFSSSISTSTKPKISVDNFISELSNLLRSEFGSRGVKIRIRKSMGDTIRQYPENLSYITRVHLDIDADGYDNLGGALHQYHSNQDKVKDALERAGTSYEEVMEFNSNDTDLWTKETISDMNSLKHKVWEAESADAYRRREDGWDIFQKQAKQKIDDFLQEYKDFDIMGKGSLGTVTGTGVFSKVKLQNIECPIKKVTYTLHGLFGKL